MLYVIYATDRPDCLELRAKARPEHIDRLLALQNEGRLLTAGPCPALDSDDPGEVGFTGSVIIAEFPSLDAAQRWAQDDPYVRVGVYDEVRVKPFKKVFG